MTYRSSSTQFILTLGMSILFLTVPCPPAPIIIRGSLGGLWHSPDWGRKIQGGYWEGAQTYTQGAWHA